VRRTMTPSRHSRTALHLPHPSTRASHALNYSGAPRHREQPR
jgi:hypothetical protein